MAEELDALESRSADERAAAIAEALPRKIAIAQTLPGYNDSLAGIDPATVTDRAALTKLPVLRKGKVSRSQFFKQPFGGYTARPLTEFTHIFQSPGPLYEPGMNNSDWWRLGRFFRAAGVGSSDIVQNCFGYHLTPAGMAFEGGALAVGATIIPAGTGLTELQVRAAVDLGTTVYCGTPDFLKTILDRADAMGEIVGIRKAVVSEGALYPSLRQHYADRGIACMQCYVTSDAGNIAYESQAMDGLIVDEDVIVEIVNPGTGDPVEPGEVGEVLVTTFNPDYPLIRFATGDLSAELPGQSACGRTNMRIKGWLGRVDQSTKIKGMFVRPEQVAQLVARHSHISRVRVLVTREHEQDVMTVQIEAEGGDWSQYADSVHTVLKLRGRIEVLAPGTLPRDGKVIDDRREYIAEPA